MLILNRKMFILSNKFFVKDKEYFFLFFKTLFENLNKK